VNESKPDNALRKVLGGIGVTLYHMGLAPLVIRLNANRVRALLYHAVEQEPNAFTYGLGVDVTPAAFAANLDYVQRFYNVVPMSAVAAGRLPPKPLVITFDDGYKCVHEHAMPALRERGLPACVYLISKAVQGDMVWVNLLNYSLIVYPEATRVALSAFEDLAPLSDSEIMTHVQMHYAPARIEALCRALRDALPEIDGSALYANADEIRDMQQHGLEFGFHTADHYNLRNCDTHELQRQLDSSDIAELTDSNTFAYPFGYFSEASVEQVSRHHFSRVMTVGNNNNRYSQQHLDRTEVFSASPAKIFAQLEVVEPIVAWLRSWVLRSDSARKHDGARRRPVPATSVKNPAK